MPLHAALIMQQQAGTERMVLGARAQRRRCTTMPHRTNMIERPLQFEIIVSSIVIHAQSYYTLRKGKPFPIVLHHKYMTECRHTA